MENWQWGTINVSGYQGEFQNGVIESTPDAGIPYRRERFSDIQDIFQGVFTLTKIELIDFKSWYKWIIKQGTVPFRYYDCQLGIYRTCRIIDKPTWSSNSNHFNVNIKLTFDSAIFYEPRVLVANGAYTVANPNKRIVFNKKYRV